MPGPELDYYEYFCDRSGLLFYSQSDDNSE